MVGQGVRGQLAVVVLLALASGGAIAQPPGPDVTMLSATELPTPRSGTAAVTDGRYAYVFGGWAGPVHAWGADALDEILRFDPQTGDLAQMGASLPWPTDHAAAAWDGQRYAYIFGGTTPAQEQSCPYTTDAVLRYEPAADSIEVLQDRMPLARAYAGAAWLDGAAYVVGGESSNYVCQGDVQIDPGRADILRFEPGVGFETVAVLPQTMMVPAVVALEGRLLIFGGTDRLHGQGGVALASVFQFDPATGVLSRLSDLPWAISWPSAVTVEGGVRIYADRRVPSLTDGPLQEATGGFVFWSPSGGAHVVETFSAVGGTSTVLIDGCQFVFSHFGASEEVTFSTGLSGILVHGPPSCFPSLSPSFAWSQPACGAAVEFQDTSSVTMDTIAFRSWSFDGVQAYAGPAAATIQELPPGNHTATLVVATASGLQASVTHELAVSAESCIVPPVTPPPLPLGPQPPGDGPATPADSDGDGIDDGADNCPAVRNREQADSDRDGAGDTCDTANGTVDPETGGNTGVALADLDLDGIPDAADNCPAIPNRDQADMDADHLGDVCDLDADGDGVLDGSVAGLYADNCPGIRNADQADADGDLVGDACDPVDGRLPAAAGPAAQRVRPVPDVPHDDWGVVTLTAFVLAFLLLLWRYWIVLPFLILFSRLAPAALLAHPRRQRILDLVAANPGIGFEELARRSGFARGPTRHHLQLLLAAGLVHRASPRRRSGFQLPQPDGGAAARHRAVASAGAQRLLAALEARPGMSVAQAAVAGGLSKAAAAHHVRRFAAAGLVRIGKAGRSHCIEVVTAPPPASPAPSATLYAPASSTQS